MTMALLANKWEKLGCILKPDNQYDWWVSHVMAPTVIQISESIIRVYFGAWDAKKISRITYLDVCADDPTKIINIAEKPVLDIGNPGTFDENGVFPGHITKIEGKIYLYYTGFQLGQKIRHYNFGGLAVSEDGMHFERVSQAPILDRADEGLYVRAGQSILYENEKFHTCYSAGSQWVTVGDQSRPCYDVFYQSSSTMTDFSKEGKCIVQHNPLVEHGLGRPQLIKIKQEYIVLYTRRMLNMQYYLGYAVSSDLKNWTRRDDIFIPAGKEGEFDSEMIYFPSLLQTHTGRTYLFYSGNGFGGEGLGVAELVQ